MDRLLRWIKRVNNDILNPLFVRDARRQDRMQSIVRQPIALTLAFSQRCRRHVVPSFVLLLAAIAGCGGSKTLPVTGYVTLDDRPLADAGVLFCPVAGGPAVTGSTDEAGKFRLATINQSGVLPGEYRVAISKSEVTGMGDSHNLLPGEATIQWLIPQKYGNPDSSGLTATVCPGQTEFTFAIVSR